MAIDPGSQIFPDFVQVQTVFSVIYDIRAQLFVLLINILSLYRLSISESQRLVVELLVNKSKICLIT